MRLSRGSRACIGLALIILVVFVLGLYGLLTGSHPPVAPRTPAIVLARSHALARGSQNGCEACP
jgi:hypothetical protein